MANWTHDPPNNNDNRLSFWKAYNGEGAQKIAVAELNKKMGPEFAALIDIEKQST